MSEINIDPEPMTRSVFLLFALLSVVCRAGAEASVLRFDEPVSRTIRHDMEHQYQLDVDVERHVGIELVQQGVNLGITVYAPDGRPVAQEDIQRFVYATERLSFHAAEPGRYRIRLTPLPGYQLETGLDNNPFIWDGERRVAYETVSMEGRYRLEVRELSGGTDQWARIDRLFRPYTLSRSAGVSVGIVQGGQVLFSRGYGFANLEYDIPVSPHTAFHVASVSKQFAAYALTALHDAGKLSLDDEIHQYLPELRVKEQITIRQLLNHTSGIRDQWLLAALAGWRMDDVLTQKQLLRLIFRQETLNFAPGESYHYSNSNYTLAAEIVERVTGKTLRQWTTEEVFEPLGMVHTFFYDDHEELVPYRAYSYDDRSGTVKKSVLSFATVGATSLFTTTHDFVKWMANFKQQYVGNARIFELMTTPGRLNDGTVLRYGLGVGVGQYKGIPIVDHSGVDAGYRSYMLYFPRQDLGIVILSNLASCNAVNLGQRVADILLELPESAKDEFIPGNAKRPYAEVQYTPAVSLGDYAGEYYSDELQTMYQVSEIGSTLYLCHKRFEDVRLLPAAQDRFKGTYWVFDQIEFIRDTTGRVIALQVTNGGVTRARFNKIVR